jgi:hypothetical protein
VALDELRKGSKPEPQVIAATHAPLVVASLEPYFDADKDDLFLLQQTDKAISLTGGHFAKQGDVINWLVSDTFGLRQARSLEAERAIEAAEAWMRQDLDGLPDDLRTEEAIDQDLRRVLPGHDPFWPRWVVWAREQGAAK